jgi:hypothetical protein
MKQVSQCERKFWKLFHFLSDGISLHDLVFRVPSLLKALK